MHPNDPKNLIELMAVFDHFGLTPTINRIDIVEDERVGCSRYEFTIGMSATIYPNNKEDVDLLKMTQELLNNG